MMKKSKWDTVDRTQYFLTKAAQIEADNKNRILLSTHIDDVRVMMETDSEYKLAVVISVPKAPLKVDVVKAIEDCTIFALLEIEQSAIEDHILDAVNVSPTTRAMVELVEGKKSSAEVQREWIENLQESFVAQVPRSTGPSTASYKREQWITPPPEKPKTSKTLEDMDRHVKMINEQTNKSFTLSDTPMKSDPDYLTFIAENVPSVNRKKDEE